MCWLFELTSSFDALSVRAVHKVTQRTQTNPVCCGTHHDKKNNWRQSRWRTSEADKRKRSRISVACGRSTEIWL